MSFNVDKIFKMAKGFMGRSKNCRSIARERVEKSLQKAYDMNYATFQHGLTVSNIRLDRKSLAELAKNEPYSFKALILKVKDTLASIKGTSATPPAPTASASTSL